MLLGHRNLKTTAIYTHVSPTSLGDDPKPPRSDRLASRRDSAMTRPRFEVADVLRQHGDAFLDHYGDSLSLDQRRVMGASRSAAPLRSAGTWRSAIAATIKRSPTTRAATVTAPSVAPPPRRNGWRLANPSCCRSNIFTWCSLSRRHSPRSPCRTNAWSMASCFAPPPRPCNRSPPIRSISGPTLASWPCSTHGARTSSTTRMCIALYREAGSRPTARDGSPAVRLSSCRCAS